MSEQAREAVRFYLGCANSEEIHWNLIRLAQSSVADRAITPFQDILGLGTNSRMNFPGKAVGNWGWRYQLSALTPQLRDRLKAITETYGRTSILQTS